ncbi:MAG: PCMD domain-containing protein [Bacteroidales bacterium]|nr:PCMD domain-containing protein [Bacteroidales bacterium]
MKYVYKLVICLFVVAGLLSCTQSEVGEYGYLTVGVADEVSGDVQVKSGSDVFRVQVVDSDGNIDADIADHTTITQENPIALLMGRYTVTASNGDPATGFNLPYWSGENSVRIWAERDASVDIVTKMSKVIFSVSFPTDEKFQDSFPEYSLTVTSGEGEAKETLVFSNSPKEGEGSFSDVAYFVVPQNKTIAYTLKMKNKDGAQYSSTNKIENVAAAEHYHFEFKLGDREEIDGALVLNISLDGEYKETIVHNLNLNFDKTYMPSYGHNEAFNPDEKGIVYPLGNDITKMLTFSAPRGIKSLIVSHMDYNLMLEGLPQVTDFVGISDEESNKMVELGIIGTIAEGGLSAEIDITEFVKNLSISPENTSYKMAFTVIDTYDRYARCDFEFTIVSDIQAETGSVFYWSSFAIFKGKYFSKTPPAGMTFQYKKLSDENWLEIDPSLINIDEKTMSYSYLLNGLDMGTRYTFRSTSDKDKAEQKVADTLIFTTYASESQVYNTSFDEWCTSDGAPYPNKDLSVQYVWDSANKAASGMGTTPTTQETSKVIKGSAVRMESCSVMGVLAAGNVYTGQFGSINGIGATLNWGLPFTSRPLALRGWYRYEPKPIDIFADTHKNLEGKTDICQIQIFLTNWTKQFEINTTTGKFVDMSDDNEEIIAYGAIMSDINTTQLEGNTNGYIKFTIPLEYRNLNQPTYIVISGAASRYGDYFTGGLGSTLYLDELELVYDPTELTDEEFEAVFGRIR